MDQSGPELDAEREGLTGVSWDQCVLESEDRAGQRKHPIKFSLPYLLGGRDSERLGDRYGNFLRRQKTYAKTEGGKAEERNAKTVSRARGPFFKIIRRSELGEKKRAHETHEFDAVSRWWAVLASLLSHLKAAWSKKAATTPESLARFLADVGRHAKLQPKVPSGCWAPRQVAAKSPGGVLGGRPLRKRVGHQALRARRRAGRKCQPTPGAGKKWCKRGQRQMQ